MAATKGNQFWKFIDPESIGRNLKFETPKLLWEKTIEYLNIFKNAMIIL